jgi:hypothetical protein
LRLLSTTLVLGTAACVPSVEQEPPQALATRADTLTVGYDPLPGGFDWRMEERFPKDDDGDGVREERFDAAYLHPSSYAVTFEGCPSPMPSNVLFTWVVNGVPEVGPCRWTTFLAQGTHDVKLRITESGSRTAEYPRQVVVKDWLVVSLGDSYGAGEGAPDVPGATPRWANARCHRSFNSPSARAALALEEADPHSSVTYVSLACSGANISRETYEALPTDAFVKAGTCSGSPCPRFGSGFLGGYVGIEAPPQRDGQWHPEDYLPPQVERMAELVGNRPIDALVISGGGNDVGFADILKLCVLAPGACDDMGLLGAGRKLHEEVDPLLAALPGRYDALAARIAQLGVNVRGTYLMEYPDFTRGDSGAVCDSILSGIFMLGSVDKGELEHLAGYVQGPLLGLMRTAATQHGWNYVQGISQRFTGQDGSGVGHGMCAHPSNRWVNNPQDSVEVQGGDKSTSTGKAHPNAQGYQVMAEQLLASLRATQPTLVPDRTVLRAYHTDAVYLVLGGIKVWVPSWDFLATHYGLGEADVREVPQGTLDALPTLPVEGTLMQEEGRASVHVVHGTGKYTLANRTTASAMGLHAVNVVPAGTLAHLATNRILDNVDTNGDGCTDLVRTLSAGWSLGLSVSLSNCAGGYLAPWTSLELGAGAGAVEWLTGDVDADGRTDLFQLWNNAGQLAIIVWRSTGASYEMFGDTRGVNAGVGAVKFLTADVNGDKRTDIVQLYGDATGTLNLIVHQSTGSGYVTSWSSRMPAGVGAVEWLTGDVDADGRTDLFQLWNNAGQLAIIVWRSTGAGYAIFGDTRGVVAGVGAVKFLTADVNGDRRTDIVQLYGDATGTLNTIVHQSTGSGYATSWSSRMPAGVGAMEWLTGDVDADGRTDLFQLWNNAGQLGVIVWHSTGAGYEIFGDTRGVVAGMGALKFFAGDVNGDKRTDIVQGWHNQGQLGVVVHQSTGLGYATTWGANTLGRL